eukprot:2367594-Amphidinium_carterae.2
MGRRHASSECWSSRCIRVDIGHRFNVWGSSRSANVSGKGRRDPKANCFDRTAPFMAFCCFVSVKAVAWTVVSSANMLDVHETWTIGLRYKKSEFSAPME